MKKALISAAILMIFLFLLTGCVVSSQNGETTSARITSISSARSNTSASTTVLEVTSETDSSVSEPTSQDTSETTKETQRTSSMESTTAAATQSAKRSVSISISCLRASEKGLPGTPEDGWILTERSVYIDEDDTVFDVLKQVCDEANILLMTRRAGNAVFISAIAGITATNAKSGWMFSVNDEFPMISSSAYKLDDGDVIKWQYTMDSGNDL